MIFGSNAWLAIHCNTVPSGEAIIGTTGSAVEDSSDGVVIVSFRNIDGLRVDVDQAEFLSHHFECKQLS